MTQSKRQAKWQEHSHWKYTRRSLEFGRHLGHTGNHQRCKEHSGFSRYRTRQSIITTVEEIDN
jgi:hypothetical protein